MECYLVCPKCGGIEELNEDKKIQDWEFIEEYTVEKHCNFETDGYGVDVNDDDCWEEVVKNDYHVMHSICGEVFDRDVDHFIVCVEDDEIVEVGNYWGERMDKLKAILKDRGVLRVD